MQNLTTALTYGFAVYDKVKFDGDYEDDVKKLLEG